MPALIPPWLARLGRYTILLLAGFALLFAAAWKGWILPSDRQYGPRIPNPKAVAVPAGYKVDVVATGLNAPSALEITPDGAIYIGESGYGGAYAATAGYEGVTPGRILRLGRDGSSTVVAGDFKAPLAGFFHDKDGNLIVSHNGSITAVTPAGRRDLISGLPSLGDHKNNNVIAGPDGKIYFAQGTVTNSGVVGLDNWVLWGRFFPGPKDVPCVDVKLAGHNITTADPRSLIPLQRVQTGGFQPFGHKTVAGQVVRGEVPCNGAIIRLNPDGSDVELVAWGLRNPFDLRFGPDGRLYVTDNGPDTRGSRPFEGADLFHQIKPGAWYGWPDYWNGQSVTELATSGREKPKPLLQKPPAKPEKAFLALDQHVAASGFDFAPAGFGYEGQAFIAQWGSAFPATNQHPAPVGFDILRVDPRTRKTEVFARNTEQGPASLTGGGGFERPAVARFGPDGALYVLDWGHLSVTRKGPYHVPYSGVLWRISRDGARSLGYVYRPPEPRRLGEMPSAQGPLTVSTVLLGLAGWLVWRARGKKSFRAE
ncbi:MAG TPA: PQQ-dependent sugar dehydrogenase [Symbiobacteriaceae bacterium]|nr:PQQ-dependent sugar dehydrogenase [Symbiobacteriaceae bacterium]